MGLFRVFFREFCWFKVFFRVSLGLAFKVGSSFSGGLGWVSWWFRIGLGFFGQKREFRTVGVGFIGVRCLRRSGGFLGFLAFWLLAFWLTLWPLWLWLSASSAAPVTPQHHRLLAFWILVWWLLPLRLNDLLQTECHSLHTVAKLLWGHAHTQVVPTAASVHKACPSRPGHLGTSLCPSLACIPPHHSWSKWSADHDHVCTYTVSPQGGFRAGYASLRYRFKR